MLTANPQNKEKLTVLKEALSAMGFNSLVSYTSLCYLQIKWQHYFMKTSREELSPITICGEKKPLFVYCFFFLLFFFLLVKTLKEYEILLHSREITVITFN